MYSQYNYNMLIKRMNRQVACMPQWSYPVTIKNEIILFAGKMNGTGDHHVKYNKSD
jgi:hypothetical protein